MVVGFTVGKCKCIPGCFESYPKMRFHDTAGEKIVQMGEWLNFYDHIDHRVNNTHEYGLYGYLPLPIVNFHRFFAGSAAQEHRVEYPKTDYEVTMPLLKVATQVQPRLILSFVELYRQKVQWESDICISSWYTSSTSESFTSRHYNNRTGASLDTNHLPRSSSRKFPVQDCCMFKWYLSIS